MSLANIQTAFFTNAFRTNHHSAKNFNDVHWEITMFANMKVGTKLSLGFGVTALLTLLIAIFALMRINQIDGVIAAQNQIRTQQLESLYTAREALGQTGLALSLIHI